MASWNLPGARTTAGDYMKNTLLFLSFIFMIGLCSGFSGGDGTESNPWQISNVTELQAINDNTAYYNDYFVLINDIDASVTSTWNGGAGFVPLRPFASFIGDFNGMGYNITDVYIYRPTTDEVGLFGECWAGANIHNFSIIDANVTGRYQVAQCVGYADGAVSINNISTLGGHVYSDEIAGSHIGLANTIDVVLSHGYSTASVSSSGNSGTGGGVGNNKGVIQYYYAAGPISAPSNSGGVAGVNTGTVQYSYYDSETTGQSDTGKGIPKTTAEMQTQSTFVSWDFNDIWIMQDYPVFRSSVDNIYYDVTVKDEATEAIICPDSVKIYSETLSYTGVINCSENSTPFLVSPENELYVLSVTADGYYNKQCILTWDQVYNDIDIFMVSENETVIFQKFILTDLLTEYEKSEYVIRLDKPIGDSAETVYSSYFDFNGIASTYLVASDQYILYIITPEKTITYSWLTPDPDGEINIILNEFEFSEVEDWISYSYVETNTSVAFDYESAVSITSATMTVSNESTVYNSTITTDTGSFNYVFTADGVYQIDVTIINSDGQEFNYASVKEIGDGQSVDPFPDSYTVVIKSMIVMFVIVVGVLALSSYRSDLSCMFGAGFYAFAVYQDWCMGNILTVSIVGIIAVAAIVKFQKKNNRSVN